MARLNDIWERDGGRCVWCSTVSWEPDRTLEHVLPRSRGGRSGEHNLLPACRACNKARRSQGAAAYARRQAEAGRTGGTMSSRSAGRAHATSVSPCQTVTSPPPARSTSSGVSSGGGVRSDTSAGPSTKRATAPHA
ncbi:MAG TPA: HNH endonuclease, partial [Solirubrobacteraceae bacterium]|nr:HNH endonuclease [Solirubrobacteraceae bacterium]